jgi:tetratricopeptide (TPR) repeat protein
MENMKKLFFILGIVAGLCGFGFAANSTEVARQFADAGMSYKKGEYVQSLGKYKEMEKSAPSAALYYNIGNVYYRLGKIGMALVYYERAQKLSPSDYDVNYNIKFLSDMIKDPDYRGTFIARLGSTRVRMFFGLCAFAFSIIVSIKLLRPARKLFWAFAITGMLFAVSSAAYLMVWREASQAYAVVVENNAEVRSGPDYNFKVNFTLPEGKKIIVFGSTDKWAEVGVKSMGIRGWLELKNIEFIG